MDILGIGPLELLLILVLLLVVVGPGKLPEMAARLARLIRTARSYAATVTGEFTETMHDLEQEYNEMQGEWKEIGEGLDESARSVSDELKESTRAVGEELDAASREANKALTDATSSSEESPTPSS